MKMINATKIIVLVTETENIELPTCDPPRIRFDKQEKIEEFLVDAHSTEGPDEYDILLMLNDRRKVALGPCVQVNSVTALGVFWGHWRTVTRQQKLERLISQSPDSKSRLEAGVWETINQKIEEIKSSEYVKKSLNSSDPSRWDDRKKEIGL